jgi:hypothetical protein
MRRMRIGLDWVRLRQLLFNFLDDVGYGTLLYCGTPASEILMRGRINSFT